MESWYSHCAPDRRTPGTVTRRSGLLRTKCKYTGLHGMNISTPPNSYIPPGPVSGDCVCSRASPTVRVTDDLPDAEEVATPRSNSPHAVDHDSAVARGCHHWMYLQCVDCGDSVDFPAELTLDFTTEDSLCQPFHEVHQQPRAAGNVHLSHAFQAGR